MQRSRCTAAYYKSYLQGAFSVECWPDTWTKRKTNSSREEHSTLNKSLRFENFLRSTIRFGSKNMVVPGNVWEVFEKYSHKSSDVVLNVMNGSVFVLSSFVFSISFRLSSRMKTFVIKNKPNIAYSLFNRECSREDYHNLRRASNFDSSELSKHQSHVNMSWCWNSCDKLVTCCDA